jgi:hypothetical protein
VLIPACMIVMGDVFTSEAINLGGTEVPKERFIVYLAIGHSNLAGRNITSADSVTNPQAWNYKWYGSNAFPQTPYDSAWIPAMEKNGGAPQGVPDGYYGLTPRGTGGPSMPFLKTMISRYPDYYFGIVINALTSSCVRATVNAPPYDANNYTKGSGERYAEIISFAQKIQKQATIGGIISMFGVIEVANASTAVQAFQDDITKMVADMRSDLGMPNLPFMIGCYEEGATGRYAITTANGAAISTSIKALPDIIPNSDTISSNGCDMLDNHHYNTAGQQLWASRVADCIAKHGWLSPSFVTQKGKRSDAHSGISVHYSSMGKSVNITLANVVRNFSVDIFNVRGERLSGTMSVGSGQIRCDLGEAGSGCLIVKALCSGIPYGKKIVVTR